MKTAVFHIFLECRIDSFASIGYRQPMVKNCIVMYWVEEVVLIVTVS